MTAAELLPDMLSNRPHAVRQDPAEGPGAEPELTSSHLRNCLPCRVNPSSVVHSHIG